ncbi:hypothetical protein ACFL59_03190 [Planctomycetota bacterium]
MSDPGPKSPKGTAPETTQRRRGTFSLGALAVVLCFHTLLAYGLHRDAVMVLAGLYAVFVILVGAKRGLATSLGLFLSTLVLAGALKITGLDQRIYYRPHELLAVYDDDRGHSRYRPNVQLTMDTPHGDLQTMTTMPIAVPRRVVFQTDPEGFRNRRGAEGSDYVAVGDSFVAGTGTTQEDILTEQLRRKHRLHVHNLAHAGDVTDYDRLIASFTERHGVASPVLLFLFEGNDFVWLKRKGGPGAPFAARLSHGWKEYFKLLSTTGIYRTMRSLRDRLKHRSDIRASKKVRVEDLGGETLAFYVPYILVSERATCPRLPELEALLTRLRRRIAAVFFIPTKHRVYESWLRPEQPLPHAQWAYLTTICGSRDVRCIDLTEPLVRRSKELVEEGLFTFWPDDSHWNGHGIAVAAEAVARFHRSSRGAEEEEGSNRPHRTLRAPR